MEFKKIIAAATLIGAVSFGAATASALGSAKKLFDTEYPGNTVSCFVCHVGVPGSLTSYGVQYTASGGSKGGTLSAIQAIDTLDADKDGVNNGVEIKSATTMGNKDVIDATIKSDTAGTGTGMGTGTGNAGTGTGTGTTDTGTTDTGTTDTGTTDSGSSSGGCVASTVATPLMMLVAMLTLGFFVRRKKS